MSRVSEVLARAGAGLALEGITININMAELEASSEEVGDQP